MTDARSEATIIADSIGPSGIRLTTALLTFPTMILQEVHTHRTIYRFDTERGEEWAEIDANKSTNSSRAKTTRQVLLEVWQTPFCPSRFPMRAASMHSSRGYLTGWRHHVARFLWLKSRYIMMAIALLLMCVPRCHKQIANRLLSPWMMTTMVMTAVDAYWTHFQKLRDHYMAQDEMQEVAKLFTQAYLTSTPTYLLEGEWHLPFLLTYEKPSSYGSPARAIMLSVARCARTSYAQTHQQMLAVTRPRHEDIALFMRLAPMEPEHAGPMEHQASAHTDPNYRSGTLYGWTQLRHHPIKATLHAAAASAPQVHGATTA